MKYYESNILQNNISILVQKNYVIICKNKDSNWLEYQIGCIDEKQKKIVWGHSMVYGKGKYPYCIVDNDNNFIGFYYGKEKLDSLFYQIGKVHFEDKFISMGESHKFYEGYVAWMVIDEEGNTITRTRMSKNSKEWYYTGKLDKERKILNFNNPHENSYKWDDTKINSNGIMVDNSTFKDALYYRVGKINMKQKKGEFGKSINYGQGISSYTQIDDKENVVEVHQDNNKYDLCYTVGKIDVDKKEIKWGEPQYSGTGIQPYLCFNEEGTIIEIHKSEKKEDIWYRVGRINFDKNEIKFNKGIKSKFKGDFPYIKFLDNGKVFMAYKNQDSYSYEIGEIDSKKENINWW